MGRYTKLGCHVVEGVVDAWDSYTAMCGSYDIHNTGIEAYISVKIAERLKKTLGPNCPVWLEPGVRKLLTLAGAVPRRGPLPRDMRHTGRVDIAACNAAGQARGVIEVKRHFQPSNFVSDAKRIAKLMARAGDADGGHLRWGAVVALHLVKDEKRHAPIDKLTKHQAAAEQAAMGRSVELVYSEPRLMPVLKGGQDPPIAAVGLGYLIT